MTATHIINRDEWRNLNLQINSQLRANGITDHKGRNVKDLHNEPESEWKTWILELMKMRDQLGA